MTARLFSAVPQSRPPQHATPPKAGSGFAARVGRGVRRGRAGLVVAVALVMMAPGLAAAQSADQALRDRLDRLERDIRTLNLQVAGRPVPSGADAGSAVAAGVGGDNAAYARLSVRLTELEEQIRQLTGQVEEARHAGERNQGRLDKLVSDIDFRLNALEQRTGGAATSFSDSATSSTDGSPVATALPAQAGAGGTAAADGTRLLGTIPQSDLDQLRAGLNNPADATGAATGSASSVPADSTQAASPAAASSSANGTAASSAATPASALPPGTPRERYDYSFGLLRQTRYAEAETAFRAFIEAYPDDPLVANARYWLGETYYVRNDYQQAAEVFLQGYQAAPKGPKAPDSLLKLGMALQGLGKKPEACATYGRMAQDFPKLASELSAALARERTRAGC